MIEKRLLEEVEDLADFTFTEMVKSAGLDPQRDFQGIRIKIHLKAGESLRGYVFDGSILDGSDLSGADLFGASFLETSLVGVSLKGANIPTGILTEAQIDSAKHSRTKGSLEDEPNDLLSRKSLLLIEDDLASSDFISDKIRNFGFEVDTASNLDEAFKALQTSPSYDAVITDLVLSPEEDSSREGLAVAEEIKRLGLSDVVVALSSHYSPSDMNELASSQPLDAFISKDKLITDDGFEEVNRIILSTIASKQAKKYSVSDTLEIGSNYVISQPLRRNSESNASLYFIDDSRLKQGLLHGEGTFRVPLPVWLIDESSFFRAEVYGLPSINAVGSTRDESIAVLLETIQSIVRRDMLSLDHTEETVSRLKSYLNSPSS